MPVKPNKAEDPNELRRRAEARLHDRRSKAGNHQSKADAVRELHELEVHQIELELQNAELQQTRDALEVTLEKYTDLYDFSPVSYLTLDPAGIIHEVNLTGASLLGIPRSSLVNQPFGPFVSEANRAAFVAFLKQVFEGGAREECDLSLQIAGRHPVDARLRANLLQSGQGCRVAVTDVTEHKQAEADRLILSKLESTGILAGGIAHDFNNLLTVILLDIELAQERTAPGEELAELLEEVKKAALTASGLTKQLITFAEGGAPIQKPTLLSGVIQKTVGPALSGSPVESEFYVGMDLWLTEVDPGQIGQVIHNLVLNAREAMPEGGVVYVRAENVVLSARDQPPLPAGEYVRVSIADQGAGIPEDVLPKIFDPYFSTKQRGNQKGMGLGLTICHAIVQKHGGAIAVKTEMGVGTTLYIYLPASRKLNRGEKPSLPAGVPRQGKILVMDDEEGVRRVVGLTLRRMGQEVVLVEEGQKAVEAYQKAANLGCPFDVTILDLTIRGGMGGQETIQALLKIDPAVKAIAISGYRQDPVILEPELHGFKGALAKPFDVEKLREMLSLVLESPLVNKGMP